MCVVDKGKQHYQQKKKVGILEGVLNFHKIRRTNV